MSKTIVLIDDDKIIRKAWEKEAALKEILIITYANVDLFLSDEALFQKNIDIYIDSDIEGVEGEFLASQIYTAGFDSISLITSFDFDRHGSIPSFIKRVTSKSPPF